MKFGLAFGIVFIIGIILACNGSKKAKDEANTSAEPARLFEMKKNPCFGKCPAYKLIIYDNGRVTFDGKRFVEKLGLHSKILTKREFEGIKRAFDNTDFFELDDLYQSNVPDLPKTRITYHRKGQSKTVTGDTRRPRKVKDLERILSQVADSEGWTLEKAPDFNLPDDIVRNEFIIAFMDGTNTEEWLEGFKQYKMKIVKPYEGKPGMWLLRYDESTLHPGNMINLIKMTDEVMIAEFNKSEN